jgi:hypothetical protein
MCGVVHPLCGAALDYTYRLNKPSKILELLAYLIAGALRAGARLALLSLFEPHAMSDVSPECVPKQTCIDHIELRVHALVLDSSVLVCAAARDLPVVPIRRRPFRL